MLYLPTVVDRLQEQNSSGGCYLQLAPVVDIATFPDEVRGTIPSAITLAAGRSWLSLYPTRWTQEFGETWVKANGATYSKGALKFIIPKDRAAVFYGLWQLHRGRFVVLHHDMNKTTKVLGSKTEPAMVNVVELRHGQRPGGDRNQYEVLVTVSRKTACPFYLATAPEPGVPDDCPTLEERLAVTPWGTIEDLLSEQQLADAIASLAQPCPTLCALIDEAFEGSTTLLDAVVISGAEVEGVTNGTYPEVGIDNGKPRYELGDAFVTWTNTAWVIAFAGAGGSYYSLEDVDYPWQVTEWILYGDFSGALPTVVQDSESTGGDGSAILDCLSPEQGTTLFTALLEGRAWSAIEALLSPTQLAAAEASLGGGGGSCPTLCELIEEAFAGGGGAGENSFTVSGAGISGFNVQFTVDGTNNGKDAYRNGNLSCSWSGTAWVMLDDTDGSGWWQSSSNTEFPWEATGWTAMFSYVGQAAPTLTQDGAGGGGDGTAILDCLSPEQAQYLFEGLLFADTPVVTLPKSKIGYVDSTGASVFLTPVDTAVDDPHLVPDYVAPRFVVRSSDGGTVIMYGDVAAPTVNVPQTRIEYKDETNADATSGPLATNYSGGTLRPGGVVPRRELMRNGVGTGQYATFERLVNDTIPSVSSPLKFGWGAGDADTLTWTVTTDEAGTYTTYTQDGGSGTLTYSKNGAAHASLTGTISLAVNDTITVRRTTTTNAGRVTWEP